VPALIVLAHQRGWLLWINPGWFDWKWYRLQYRRCACVLRGVCAVLRKLPALAAAWSERCERAEAQ
jgi:hypothetical protein